MAVESSAESEVKARNGVLPDTEDVAITVVLPCHNEEECVGPLMEELDRVLSATEGRHEVLFVDDASTDGTAGALAELARRHPYVRVLTHTENAGESAAGATGFRAARGDVVITMDADQQNDPADIPRLLEAVKGADAVCGVRRERMDDWVKRVSSKVANGLRKWMTGGGVTDAGCTYRAIRREALAEIPIFNGMHRWLPTMLMRQGYDVVELDVNHRPRSGGASKYGIGNRAFRGLVDCFGMRWWMMRALPGRRVARVLEPRKREA
jgi:glycosyltransferase involved in cell wall biosynthesis